MDRGVAAEAFAKMLLRVGVDQSVGSLLDSINDPSGTQKQTWKAVKKWYENESEEGKELVHFIVKRAMIRAVYSLAVEFDGLAVGYDYIGELPIEFTVGLRSYLNTDDAVKLHNPVDTIHICPSLDGENINDIFMYYLDNPEEARNEPPK